MPEHVVSQREQFSHALVGGGGRRWRAGAEALPDGGVCQAQKTGCGRYERCSILEAALKTRGDGGGEGDGAARWGRGRCARADEVEAEHAAWGGG